LEISQKYRSVGDGIYSLLFVGYLKMLSESRLYSVEDTMINEYGPVGGNENWDGALQYLEKTYPSTTLSTTSSRLSDPGSNPGH
jgi:hypothetical protein